MKKVTGRNGIRLVKLTQFALFLMGIIALKKGFPVYVSQLMLIMIILLTLLLPKPFRGLIVYQKTTFLTNDNVILESIITCLILVLLVLLLIFKI